MAVKKTNTHIVILSSVLNSRYKKCDSEGHVNPDNDKNRCEHCYRTLDYKTPVTDAKYSSRKNLPFWKQPLDAPVIAQERNDEISSQKSLDFLVGVRKIADELKLI